MKKQLLGQILMALVVTCYFVPDAAAIGMGLYLNAGTGDAEYEADPDPGADFDFDSDTDHRGLGFVLDTAVANDRVFNYRLNIGLDKWEEDIDGGSEWDLEGFLMSHDFGFGIVRQPNFRVWLGPEIRIHYGSGDLDSNSDFDIHMFKFAVGPVLGFNINVGEAFTLGIKTGYLFESFWGHGEDDVTGDEEDYDGHSNQAFINLSFIFRINDMF